MNRLFDILFRLIFGTIFSVFGILYFAITFIWAFRKPILSVIAVSAGAYLTYLWLCHNYHEQYAPIMVGICIAVCMVIGLILVWIAGIIREQRKQIDLEHDAVLNRKALMERVKHHEHKD